MSISQIEDDLDQPHSIEAEQGFIGSFVLIEDDSQRRKMREMVWPDAFYQEDHKIMFEVACAVLDSGKALDSITLCEELKQRGQMKDVGGLEYIAQIYNKMPSAAHGEHYARIVEDLAVRRLGIKVANRLRGRLLKPANEILAADALNKAAADLWKIQQRKSRVEVFKLGDIAADFLQSKEDKKPASLLTGIDRLDMFAGTFSFGKYTIVAGRPSMGKSTFLRWLLLNWAKAGTPVGLVAVEEDRQKIAGNYISAWSGIENDTVAYRELHKDQWEQATTAVSQMSQFPWFGVDTAFTSGEVSAAVDLLVTQYGCRVIAVDHIHLIKLERATETEQREIKEVSRKLKELAKQYQVVLIAAAQLSRPEKIRVPPPPSLTDLRASGAIEEHADAVILLHREDYYRQPKNPTRLCEIGVAKNRNGRRGRVGLREELEFQRFREPTLLEEAEWEAGNRE